MKEKILEKLEHKIEAFGGMFVASLFFEMVFMICKHTAGMIVLFALMLITGIACKMFINLKDDIERWS